VGAPLLEEGSGLQPPSLWAKFVELNGEMLRANRDLNKEHKFGSRWWEWPLMMRTVLYWAAKAPPYVDHVRTVARIYCIGSPAVWWSAALAPAAFVIVWLGDQIESKPAADSAPPAANGWLLLVGYVVNWLPFILVQRTQFLYHFLPSLLFSLLLLAHLFDTLVPPTPLLQGRRLERDAAVTTTTILEPLGLPLAEAAQLPEGRRWLLAGVLLYAFAFAFAFFAPLAYGFPLEADEMEARMWLRSWS